MPNPEYNPIRSVDGAPVRCPSGYVYDLQDVSAPDAGRTEDVIMDKMRVAQKVKLSLKWVNVPTDEASLLLRQFNPEYIVVEYLDVMEGGYVTKTFYVGDRSAPSYNVLMGLWESITFGIIER